MQNTCRDYLGLVGCSVHTIPFTLLISKWQLHGYYRKLYVICCCYLTKIMMYNVRACLRVGLYMYISLLVGGEVTEMWPYFTWILCGLLLPRYKLFVDLHYSACIAINQQIRHGLPIYCCRCAFLCVDLVASLHCRLMNWNPMMFCSLLTVFGSLCYVTYVKKHLKMYFVHYYQVVSLTHSQILPYC